MAGPKLPTPEEIQAAVNDFLARDDIRIKPLSETHPDAFDNVIPAARAMMSKAAVSPKPPET